MARYGAIVDGKRGAHGVIIPDLPGCTAMGRTLDEALANAASAARAWAEVAIADGFAIPKPRAIEALRNDPEVADEIAEGGTLAIVIVAGDDTIMRATTIVPAQFTGYSLQIMRGGTRCVGSGLP